MTDYAPPTIRNGTWYPEAGQKIVGRLISVTGVGYEFEPDRPIPLLTLAIPADTDAVLARMDSTGGEVEEFEATQFVEVHCFPKRLLRQVEAVAPVNGEMVEISTAHQLVGGFLDYVVAVGTRVGWPQWGPIEVETTCSFAAQPAAIPAASETAGETASERTAVFHPVTVPDVDAEEALAGLAAANPLFVPSPTPREVAK